MEYEEGEFEGHMGEDGDEEEGEGEEGEYLGEVHQG